VATYEIEQYELHAQVFVVEADSPAEAIKKLFDGEADVADGGFELIEVADKYGLPAEENRELVDALRELGVDVREVVPSIRQIEET